MSEHAVAREWEMQLDARSQWWMVFDGPMSQEMGEHVKVREVRPGEITLTREELIHVFARAYCAPGNTHKVLDSEIGIAMAAELFPEGKEVAK